MAAHGTWNRQQLRSNEVTSFSLINHCWTNILLHEVMVLVLVYIFTNYITSTQLDKDQLQLFGEHSHDSGLMSKACVNIYEY